MTPLQCLGERLRATRTVRQAGHGAMIQVPLECIGTRYVRYYDRETGILTFIPAETHSSFVAEEA